MELVNKERKHEHLHIKNRKEPVLHMLLKIESFILQALLLMFKSRLQPFTALHY